MTHPPADAIRTQGGEEAFAAMRGRRLAVLGGLGFIGSALARGLADSGANVLVIDNEATGSGANAANLRGYERKLELVRADIRDITMLRDRLTGCEVIFNLAAESSHLGSMEIPLLDLDVNAGGSLAVLEASRKVAPEAVIVFASTRQAADVGTAIHYATPVHLQPAFAGRTPSLPHTEQAAKRVLSLPIYPELSDEQIRAVIYAVVSAF